MIEGHIWFGARRSARAAVAAQAGLDDTTAPAGPKVLVIEDDPIVSLGLEHVLAEAGYVVVATCARGEEAVAAAAAHAPDLVLADVKLRGEMDGIGAAAAIRQERDVRVVFVTAHTDTRTRERMLAVRPAGILAKPVGDDALLRAVAAALNEEPRRA